MKTIGLILIIGALLCPWVEGRTTKTVERGSTVSVTMQFTSDIQSENALLVWQTYDDVGVKHKGLATVFSCSGSLARNVAEITIPCRIPADVADGHYYLISVIMGAHDYSWTGESPFDINIHVGGSTSGSPILKTIQVTRVEGSK